MKTLRTFAEIVDGHTIAITVLAMIATFVADFYGLSADMPTTIISIAVIFPIVFSINAAYSRREEALKYLASLRANLGAIYFAHRDWQLRDPRHAERGLAAVGAAFGAVQAFLDRGARGQATAVASVYEALTGVSKSIETLREGGLSGSEVSRVNQYVRGAMHDFELIRNIASYRTPIPLRAYSRVFLNGFPVLFGPYFAFVGNEFYPAVGYAVAALYALVLVSLDNIQERLENPFDAVGADDVRLESVEAYTRALG